MNRVRLDFPGKGRFQGKEVIFHADTLFSALVNCYALLYGEEGISDFIEKLHISSLFFGFAADGEEIDFYPAPLAGIRFTQDTENKEESVIANMKKSGKIRFVSGKMFEHILENLDGSSSEIKEAAFCELWDGFFIHREELPCSINWEKFPCPISITPVRGNTIHRRTNESGNTFVRMEREFSPLTFTDAHPIRSIIPYYFFLTTNNPHDSRMKAVYNLFCEEGIGGGRSRGLGRFSRWSASRQVFREEIRNHNITLSPVFPGEGEAKSAASYTLCRRGGFIYREGGRGYKKSELRMFSEGSLFSAPVNGALYCDVDIQGIGKVFQYGKAFLLKESRHEVQT